MSQQDNFDIQEEEASSKKYITMRLSDQLFGLPVDNVEDILLPQEITPIPLSLPEVVGSLNLRGRIVTAIDLRVKLGHPERDNIKKYRSVVVNWKGSHYSLIVDSVSEVIDLKPSDIGRQPENLSEQWKKISTGVYPMKEELMLILDVEKLLGLEDDANFESIIN